MTSDLCLISADMREIVIAGDLWGLGLSLPEFPVVALGNLAFPIALHNALVLPSNRRNMGNLSMLYSAIKM